MRADPTRPRGATLLELMVSVVIALLVSLTATGSAIYFTASQRQAAGTTSAFSSANMIMSTMKEELAQAGLGFLDGNILCSSLNVSAGSADFSQPSFSPLQATRDAQLNDRIDIFYGDAIVGGTNVVLSAASDLASAQLSTFTPASVGQAVLLAPQSASPTPCTVRSVTAVTPAAAGVDLTLAFDGTGLHNGTPVAAPAVYPAHASRLGVLGTLSWNRYRLVNEDLVLEQPMQGTSAVLLHNVMAMRVQYGVSAAAGETSLTQWQEPTGDWAALSAANIGRVKAMRVGVLVRSAQREKARSDGSCEASATRPEIFGSTVEVPGSDWSCFRYRTATVVVPLRNVVMGTGVLQ